jgi:hypothetical protein
VKIPRPEADVPWQSPFRGFNNPKAPVAPDRETLYHLRLLQLRLMPLIVDRFLSDEKPRGG